MGKDRPGRDIAVGAFLTGRPRGSGVPGPGAPPQAVLYGRRRGRPLRAGQRELLNRLLPELSIEPDADGGMLDLPGLFQPAPDAYWLEIGFGAGEHLAGQAAARPDTAFLGCEPFVNGVVRLLAHIRERKLTNIRLYTGDARHLLARIPDGTLSRAFVLFPDPWPKARHHKRRMISPPVISELARTLAGGAELRVATDDPGYLDWILHHLVGHRDFEWLARRPADWRIRPADWPATRYEEKALKAGRTPAFLRFSRR